MSDAGSAFELSLTVGDTQFSASGTEKAVREAFDVFREWVDSGSRVGTPALQTGQSPPTHAAATTPQAASSPPSAAPSAPPKVSDSLPLKPFLADFKLRGNKERAAGIAAWSAASGNGEELSLEQFEQLWKRSGAKMPGNLGRDVRAAEKDGWLHESKNDKTVVWSITSFGEGEMESWKTGHK